MRILSYKVHITIISNLMIINEQSQKIKINLNCSLFNNVFCLYIFNFGLFGLNHRLMSEKWYTPG